MHYPHQVLPHAVFCGASSIPSSQVDAWFEAKPLRIITICYPHDRFRYFHTALLEQSAGMADSYYILFSGWNDFSEDGNKDQEMEGVKQGLVTPVDHTSCQARLNPRFFRCLRWWTCLWLKLIWVKSSVTYSATNIYGQYWQFRFYLPLLGERTMKCRFFSLDVASLATIHCLSSPSRSTPGSS